MILSDEIVKIMLIVTPQLIGNWPVPADCRQLLFTGKEAKARWAGEALRVFDRRDPPR
jgi:hypothetical protein